MDDYRSDRSGSPEGKGRARAAWDTYTKAVGKAFGPAVRKAARIYTMDQLGFWLAWHLYGGFEGVQEALGMHPSTIWRKVAKFRKTFGVHPDEFSLPGVTIQPAVFWEATGRSSKGRKSES